MTQGIEQGWKKYVDALLALAIRRASSAAAGGSRIVSAANGAPVTPLLAPAVALVASLPAVAVDGTQRLYMTGTVQCSLNPVESGGVSGTLLLILATNSGGPDVTYQPAVLSDLLVSGPQNITLNASAETPILVAGTYACKLFAAYTSPGACAILTGQGLLTVELAR